MARLGFMGGGTIDGDDLGSFFRANGVSFKTLAVIQVIDLDLLILENAGHIQQIAIDGAGAFILQFRVGNAGLVQLGFQHGALHIGYLSEQATDGLGRLSAGRQYA
eukprot:gnl/TRDRNA2_/TRDRNA2_171260_c1_seq2.p1 gnl/TRDRNA2_/TRDRNA2_171260_c1~~gnl/TRDRNA2_/TRDRNA2_171260_c1_seq2.p1  ORF type:complete len:106 (+),score=10.09 gnl/TRDRNA2_/TRDRNA2_171260_c1_seq2:41-358(+)